jgi:hypothetical protein
LRDLDRAEEAIDWLRRAAQLDSTTCAGAIHAKLPGGPGLGRLGLLPPNAEPTIWWIACLVELDRIAEAVSVIDRLDGVLGRAVTSTLAFGDRPELEPVRAALARARERNALR